MPTVPIPVHALLMFALTDNVSTIPSFALLLLVHLASNTSVIILLVVKLFLIIMPLVQMVTLALLTLVFLVFVYLLLISVKVPINASMLFLVTQPLPPIAVSLLTLADSLTVSSTVVLVMELVDSMELPLLTLLFSICLLEMEPALDLALLSSMPPKLPLHCLQLTLLITLSLLLMLIPVTETSTLSTKTLPLELSINYSKYKSRKLIPLHIPGLNYKKEFHLIIDSLSDLHSYPLPISMLTTSTLFLPTLISLLSSLRPIHLSDLVFLLPSTPLSCLGITMEEPLTTLNSESALFTYGKITKFFLSVPISPTPPEL
jgi:hypothetical protein